MFEVVLATTITVAMMGQDPGSIVQEQELGPPGETPPAVESPAPPPIPETVEAGAVRRTFESPEPDRSVAAFWFVD